MGRHGQRTANVSRETLENCETGNIEPSFSGRMLATLLSDKTDWKVCIKKHNRDLIDYNHLSHNKKNDSAI